MRYSFLKISARAAILALLTHGWSMAVQAADPATHTVTIEAMKFSPATVRVHPGDTIVFKNADPVPHTVTEMTSKAFDSGILAPKAEWTFVPKNGGTIRYQCTLHPGMEGTIVVEGPSGP